jgi:NAD(P)H-dependent FMN reductase
LKKILGIIGSPRKLGNCEIMVKEISKQISIPHELNLLRLHDFKILPCRACYQCLYKTQQCGLEDDLAPLINAVLDADALIVSVPTYFLGINSYLKQFLDRGLALLAHIEKLWLKPAVGVVIAGIEGKEGYSLLGLQSFLKLIFAEDKGCRIVYGALPGEVFMNPKNKQTAAGLACALFEPCVEKKGACCPICGGDTFRFIENNRVRCMLCSNSGIMTMKEDTPVFEIKKSDHELFLSKKDAIKHREWLLGMKSRFVGQKKALKKITVSYFKQGRWIKP